MCNLSRDGPQGIASVEAPRDSCDSKERTGVGYQSALAQRGVA